MIEMIENIHPDIEHEYNEIVELEYFVVKKRLMELTCVDDLERSALKSSMIKWAVICNHKQHFDCDDLISLMFNSETCGLCMFFNTCTECCEYTGMKFDDYAKCFDAFADAYEYRLTGYKNKMVYYALEKVYNEKYGSD